MSHLPTPSSPSWSVPLHRPPPGVMYSDTPPPGQQQYGGYPPPPPSAGWGPGPSNYWPQHQQQQQPQPMHNGLGLEEKDGGGAKQKKRKKGSPAQETDKEKEKKEKEKEKRTKTGRACDACRTKKIRCDILSPEDSLGRDALCAHCKQYGLECTFFLPITETRFKKRRQTEDAIAGGQASEQASAAGRSPQPLVHDTGHAAAPRAPERPREIPARLEGPTSLSFLLHTTLPASTSEAYDLRNHNKWEISEDGNGLIRVNAPPTGNGNGSGGGYADADPDDPSRQHGRLNKPVLSAVLIEKLVNAYFDHLAPLFPVVSRADFAAKSNPSPLLLYSICGLAATMRQFPREVFSSVRGVINGLLRSNDILSDARFEHVQALLLLGQAGDLHAQPTAATASASLIRMGTATRMAQDLGLHRESNLRAQTPQDLAYVELRRRVWAACVIFDRWYGAALGIPLLVDLCDCDVLLPAPYEIVPELEPSEWPIDTSFLALGEHLKLSILVGRVLKTIYSPTGLKHATDQQLEMLLADMDGWLENLPEVLQYRGPQSSHMAGLLHLGHCAVQFLFWRVFMRITYTCPPHLTTGLKTETWSKLVKWGQESIEWLQHNDSVLDTLFIYPYTATNAALIQYHTWARRKDPAALESLKVIKEVASSWERKVQPDQMSIRRKTCETMTLLYEAALKTTASDDTDADAETGQGAEGGGGRDRPHNVNPTAGVHVREDYGKSVFVKDPSRPGGGIWVAQSEADRLNAGPRLSEVVLASEYAPAPPPAPAPQGQVVAPAAQPMSFPQPQPQQDPSANEMDMWMQMQSVNVNPNINVDMGQVQVGSADAGMVLNNPGQDLFTDMGGTGFDASLLEGLPMSQFNWTEWNTYFEQIDKMQQQQQQQQQPNGNLQQMNGGGDGGRLQGFGHMQ